MSKDKTLDAVTIEITKDDAISKFLNMRQNIDRAIRLIELDAPLCIVKNETRMIQRKALWAEAYYEEYIEMKEEAKKE